MQSGNNPGDPTNLNNHSGNGIIAGFCKNILIEYCTANNNGWDMPRIGNGPVGIWCYEADSVIIQHCISYQNKTSKGGEDGGGYDLMVAPQTLLFNIVYRIKTREVRLVFFSMRVQVHGITIQ